MQIVFIIVILAAWLTHVVTCINATAWGMLIAGGLIMPVGMIHGIMIWCGGGAV